MINNTIVIDLDGTILKKDIVISKDIRKKLKELSLFNDIVIATGNNYLETIEIIKKNKLYGIINDNIICSNGEVIYNIAEENVVFKKNIKYSKLIKIINYLNENNIYWFLINANNLYCNSIKYNSIKYVNNIRYKINIIDDYSSLKNIQIEKFIINSDSFENMRKIIVEISNKYHVNFFKDIRKKKYNDIVYYQNNILPLNINKYTSLKKIITKNKLFSDIIAIGDGINDYEIIKNSKYGICYQKSNDILKENSCFVIPNNKDILYAFTKIDKWYK